MHGNLEQVLAVTVEELMEYNWRDFLTEEMYEENFEAYLEQMSKQMTATGQNHAEEKEEKEDSSKKRKIVRVSEEDLKKVYTYIELNFGKTYLSPLEEKKINFQLCRRNPCRLWTVFYGWNPGKSGKAELSAGIREKAAGKKQIRLL